MKVYIFCHFKQCSPLEATVNLLLTHNVLISSLILATMMMEEMRSSESSLLQDPHTVKSLKTTFFIVTAVKT
jgi:ABC-type sulfate transport system permease component